MIVFSKTTTPLVGSTYIIVLSTTVTSIRCHRCDDLDEGSLMGWFTDPNA